jgi:hypothetical protein
VAAAPEKARTQKLLMDLEDHQGDGRIPWNEVLEPEAESENREENTTRGTVPITPQDAVNVPPFDTKLLEDHLYEEYRRHANLAATEKPSTKQERQAPIQKEIDVPLEPLELSNQKTRGVTLKLPEKELLRLTEKKTWIQQMPLVADFDEGASRKEAWQELDTLSPASERESEAESDKTLLTAEEIEEGQMIRAEKEK